MAKTKPIRAYDTDVERLEQRGSMGDSYPEVLESALDRLEELEARLEDDTHRSPNKDSEKENASA